MKIKLVLIFMVIVMILVGSYISISSGLYSKLFYSNKITLSGENEMLRNIRIIWVGESSHYLSSSKKFISGHDTLLIYNYGKQTAKIPDQYGNNRLLIYSGQDYLTNVGFFKFKSWTLNNYKLDFYSDSLRRVLKWKISGPYGTDGVDTL